MKFNVVLPLHDGGIITTTTLWLSEYELGNRWFLVSEIMEIVIIQDAGVYDEQDSLSHIFTQIRKNVRSGLKRRQSTEILFVQSSD